MVKTDPLFHLLLIQIALGPGPVYPIGAAESRRCIGAVFFLVLPPPQGTADVTPSNTTWFNDIVTAASTGTSNTVTVAGINRRITLSLSCTEPDGNYAVRVYINGQLATNQTNAPISAASPLEFTVSNGDDIYIWANGGDTRDATAIIRNVSDGNVQLGNSFLITLND